MFIFKYIFSVIKIVDLEIEKIEFQLWKKNQILTSKW